ncbi:HNH endonuclease domain-containing protein [Kribbella sp. NPDC023855]|uniref:HNH endonuclease domain-containing protein n=1 Tax=Kribbella sp. NPDC023855 TaxID=3154698 RepID=UPI0033F7D2C0
MKSRLLAVVVLVPVMLSGCSFPQAGADPGSATPSAGRPTKPPAVPPSSGVVTGTAKAIVGELGRARVVAARPEVPGYKRDQFGQAWSDNHSGLGGHNGCDTRNDVLAAQLEARKYRGKSRCVVIAGTLRVEPYTGKRIEFRKEAASAIQIDHIYPLSRA